MLNIIFFEYGAEPALPIRALNFEDYGMWVGSALSVDWYGKNNAEICLARGRFRSGRRWEYF